MGSRSLALYDEECQQLRQWIEAEAKVPTYQYACTTCGHRLEAVQSFSDEPLTACPQCDGRLRKLFSAVGIVFKGSGFYRTDARAESRRSSLSATPSKELTTVGSSKPASESSGSTTTAPSSQGTAAASGSGSASGTTSA
jgi:putative FmdB family regulatory protein